MDNRAEKILELIIAFGRLEFDKKIETSEANDILDAIGTGVNMLGEELETKVINLEEKEQLLKELHHRVKNNMQIIVSMLNLQVINESDQKLLDIIEDCKARINAMALVHELLYLNDTHRGENISKYVDILAKTIFDSILPSQSEVSLEIDIIDDKVFELDELIPIGLLLNEMLSNSLKHAFPDNKGLIKIESSVRNDNYIISYSDNGIGLKSEKVEDHSDSLGIQLIHLLSEQLAAHLEVINENGLRYQLVL